MTINSDEARRTIESLNAVGSPAERRVRPLAPVGWRYVPTEVWGDQVLTQDAKTADLARQYGREVEPLYTLNHDEVAAVNKLRATKEQARQRDLKACRCDHCEYCRHCWPEDFRPGGLWAGYGA